MFIVHGYRRLKHSVGLSSCEKVIELYMYCSLQSAAVSTKPNVRDFTQATLK